MPQEDARTASAKESPRQSRGGFWFTAAAIAAPAYYLVIVRPNRKDDPSVVGWILGYFVFVLLAAWLLRFAKIVLGSKLGRLVVLAYLTIAFFGVFAVPMLSAKISFRESGSLGLILAIVVLVKGVGLLFESWEDELKK